MQAARTDNGTTYTEKPIYNPNMARILTIANNKGGVGKTTTAVSMGAALRLRGFDVLVIDYDGQANTTETLRVPTYGGTTYDAMKQRTTPYITPVRVLDTQGGTCGVLDVLPACIDVSALETELSNQPDRLTRFSNLVAKYRDKYDIVIVDTPPTLGLLTISALYATDELIVTVQPQYLAVKGLLTLYDTIGKIDENRADPIRSRILFTQYDRRKGLHRLTADEVAAAGFKVYDTKIRDNVALGEAPAAGLDIFRYNARSNGAADYDALVDEYLNGRKLRHVKHRY